MTNQPSDHANAVNDVAAALKQVLSVSPQLLYEAAAKLGSEYAVEVIRASLTEGSEKQAERLYYRGAICLMLSRFLVQSGRATLTNDDVASISAYLSLTMERKP